MVQVNWPLRAAARIRAWSVIDASMKIWVATKREKGGILSIVRTNCRSLASP